MLPNAFSTEAERDAFRREITAGIPDPLPAPASDPAGERAGARADADAVALGDTDDVSHAPARTLVLSPDERAQALRNALRYFPRHQHAELAREFAAELQRDGRIYMRRLRPRAVDMRARPIDDYPARSRQAAAIMHMIQNNLDARVAQHPHELITYGGNGTVFQNWAQYRLTMKYLAEMSDEQTLVLYSGHPLGLFPSRADAPRLIVTCGMMVPNYSTPAEYERLAALGVTSYGQMTAGSFMYIGPQGIVHGTTITLLGASRQYLKRSPEQNLSGTVFVSSGLGGMSGAQAKAAVIAGAVGVIAEVDEKALKKRHEQGWVQEVESDVDKVLSRIERARRAGEALSLGYLGNVVDLWEHLAKQDVAVELGSDQTSLHNPFAGGYYPVGIDVASANDMMRRDPERFADLVRASLCRQVDAINRLTARGMHFWDYGNAFLLEASRAKADIMGKDGRFRYPSYVEDIMGPLYFDYGFGPFRWVCTSGDPGDLAISDQIAAGVLAEMQNNAPDPIQAQISDNLTWIQQAGGHNMVVGSQARILYADAAGRIAIAQAFNQAIAGGEISAPIVLGRDHHDVSGTDSPFRETANIRDGSNLCADMAVHNAIGDSFRGATWVSLHNGGGVGWGRAINGGFGLVLDGSEAAAGRLRDMLFWDVNNGIARRAWAQNPSAHFAIERAMAAEPRLHVTVPNAVDEDALRSVFADDSDRRE